MNECEQKTERKTDVLPEGIELKQNERTKAVYKYDLNIQIKERKKGRKTERKPPTKDRRMSKDGHRRSPVANYRIGRSFVPVTTTLLLTATTEKKCCYKKVNLKSSKMN